MESDLNLYLDCILMSTSKESQRRSLCALAELLSTNGDLKTVFRESKGLQILIEFLITGHKDNLPFLQTTMYTLTCAVDSCVSSQNVLIHEGVIGLLSKLLKEGPSSQLFHSAACLLSFVTQGNSLGQNKSRQEGVISLLTSCVRGSCPVSERNIPVWYSCLTSLSSLVNNPRNSLNQEACMEIIPFCLKALLTNSSVRDMVISISNFMRLCLSDNTSNQERFFKIGGVKVCVEMLHRCQESETAWSIISLINSVPKGILLSPDIQISCVPLLLDWICTGNNERIPIGLQALSIAIENNEEARAALMADKNGMSSIIRCMDKGDEGSKKTAKLLLQSVFTTKEKTKQSYSCSDESDLESASHEITKLKNASFSQKLLGPLKKRRKKGSKKRSFVVKSVGSWVVPAKKQSNMVALDTEQQTPKSQSGKISRRYIPRTPEPTPALYTHRDSNKKSRHSVTTIPVKENLVAPHTDCNVKTPSKCSASIASRTVEEKMNTFLEQLERIISTADPVTTRDPGAASPGKPSQTTNEKLAVEKRTDCNASLEQLNIDPERFRTSSLTFEDTISRVTGQFESTGLEIDDAMSSITDISQTNLYTDFFHLNPLLIPSERDQSVPQHYNSVPQNFSKPRIFDEDSGYDVSLPDSLRYPKMNLTQRFNKVQSSEREEKQSICENSRISLHLDEKETQSFIARDVGTCEVCGVTCRCTAAHFTEQEVANLCRGVQLYGRSWSLILARFNFHSSRTPALLRRKYGRIRKFLNKKKMTKVDRSTVNKRRFERLLSN